MDRVAREREEAWVGDAVLALHTRLWILAREGKMNGELLSALTSNQFLSRFGHPTAVEAAIGRAFGEGGLEAARGMIRDRLESEMERYCRRRTPGRR